MGRRHGREFDVVLAGATGFVGRLTAEHLVATAPDGARIALAGRSADRLDALAEQLGEVAGARAGDWPRLVVDVTNEGAAAELAGRTAVVATTVGPYLRYGHALAGACAQAGTDYADLTGEVLYVRRIIDEHHATAERTGARIVPACGFDAIPSDLGVWMTAQAAAADGAGTLTDTTLFVRRIKAGVSGGTLDSARVMAQEMSDGAVRRIVADPYALSPDRDAEPDRAGRPGSGTDGASDDRSAASTPRTAASIDPRAVLRRVRRAVPIRRDEETGHVTTAFMMGPFNSRIVRRSNALTGWSYGQGLRYRELFDAGTGPSGLRRAVLVTAGVAGLGAGLAFAPTRVVLDRILPAPGEGPSEETMRAGRFVLEIEADTTSGARYRTRVAADLDPGYRGTAVMFGQSALALAFDDLPARGGVLTPATALDGALAARLREHGFTLETTRL